MQTLLSAAPALRYHGEGIQLLSWDVWLNSGPDRNKLVEEILQQEPQQTAALRLQFNGRTMMPPGNHPGNRFTSAIQYNP